MIVSILIFINASILGLVLFDVCCSTFQTLCFHLGMTEAFVWDYGTPLARRTDPPETKAILKELHLEFVKNNGAIQYSHKVGIVDDIL